MTPDARVVLLRHGATLDTDVCHGARSDPELSSIGVRQAKNAALRCKVLAGEVGKFTRLLSSPAERAIQTTAELAVSLGLTPAVDERWRERDFGAWEGRPWDELWPTVDPEILADHAAYSAWTPPDGETAEEVRDRVAPALLDALDGTGTTIVVTHAGVIRTVLALALDMELRSALGVEIAHARAVVLSRTDDALTVNRIGA